MDRTRQREIASKGGHGVPPEKRSFSKNRHGRFRESDVFRHVFEAVLQRCMTEGLVRGEGRADRRLVGTARAWEDVDTSNVLASVFVVGL